MNHKHIPKQSRIGTRTYLYGMLIVLLIAVCSSIGQIIDVFEGLPGNTILAGAIMIIVICSLYLLAIKIDRNAK